MGSIQKQPTPILSVVGNSGSGKTVYLEKLIPALKMKGLRIGVIKNDTHGFDIDIPGKDSWRITQAGADITMIASPDKLAVIEKWKEKEELQQLALRMNGVDLVLTEGFRLSSAPKIEVRRAAAGNPPICEPLQLFAVVSDIAPPDDSVPWLPLDDAEPLADLVLGYIKTYKMGAE